MDIKQKLKKEVWNKEDYYHDAHKGSLDIRHPGMGVLIQLAKNSSSILDLGCGDGTRLNLLAESNKTAVGIDLSQTAIKMARSSYPNLRFLKADLERIPLEDESFDLIYSAFVLEHLSNSKQVIKEVIRVLKKDGFLVLIAPNYGAPNRASPPFKGSRVKKLLYGLAGDFLLFGSRSLDWRRVTPIANSTYYEMDWDTAIEPYLGSLINFLKFQKMKITLASSCWSEELPGAKIHQRIFRILGDNNIYPFWMWGPHLVVVAKKDAR